LTFGELGAAAERDSTERELAGLATLPQAVSDLDDA
jgi:hypothetical protein